MRSRQIDIDIISYNASISACEKGQQWRVALTLLDDLCESNELQPDVFTYNAAILSCSSSYQWMLAFDLLDSMACRGIELDANCYSRMIFECEQRGLVSREVALIRQLCADLENDSFSPSVVVLSSDVMQVHRDVVDTCTK